MLPLLLAMLAGTAQDTDLPTQLVNPSFEQGLTGWTVEAAPGFSADHRGPGGRRRATHGAHWLSIARAPGSRGSAEMRVFTAIDARTHRGRQLRLTASTWLPDHADRQVRMFARTIGPSGETLETVALMASRHWLRQSLLFAVPHEAQRIEIGFIVPAGDGTVDVDALRLEPAQR